MMNILNLNTSNETIELWVAMMGILLLIVFIIFLFKKDTYHYERKDEDDYT